MRRFLGTLGDSPNVIGAVQLKEQEVGRHHLCSAAVALIAITGCNGSSSPIVVKNTTFAQFSRSSNGYIVLHNFGQGADGQTPKAAVVNVGETLYGTTYAGGSAGDGTVFNISTSGSEKVLYSFQGGNDGANPAASLLATRGALYGTTEYGGIPEYGGCNAGTVFRLSRSGAERVVYRFYGNYCHDHTYNDGGNPTASVISAGDRLYGATSSGGANNYGTVVRISPRGREKVLHSFEVHTDGAVPSALVAVNGTLYGTAVDGGGNSSTSDTCCGIIYSMGKSGDSFNILYVFHGPNGAYPQAGLINIRGRLYGTTAYGGIYYGGTGFSMTTGGSITTLHNFAGGSSPIDSSHPYAPLLNVGGVLYGTTSGGGEYGEGTIFKMSLTGETTVLHSFGHGADGAVPIAGLTNVKGVLYGTTSAGGTKGKGTVFALKL